MSKTVRLPDGRTMSVPDQASDEQIQQLVEQEISGGQSAPTMGERAVGVGETAATLASGAVAEPLAGLAGLGTSLYEMVRGNDDVLASTVDRIESVRDALTFEPTTEAGRQTLETVAKPFQAVGRFADEAGERASQARPPFRGPRDRRVSSALGIVMPEEAERREETLEAELPGSPAVGAAVRTAIEAGPMALGSRRIRPGDTGPTVSQRRRDVREVKQGAREADVNLRARPERQTEQLGEAGQRRAGDLQRGEGFEDVRQGVMDARDAAKKQIDALYEEARGAGGSLPAQEAAQFAPMARNSLKSFDVDDMPIVKRRLAELDELQSLPENSAVTLKAIEDWRKRLNKNRPAATDRTQGKALNILKAQADNFLESKFNADMIKGDPTAIRKWQEARSARQRYGEIFEDDKVIRQLAERNVTPEEMKQWIFGASAAGMKKEAARTIRNLKNIIGERSPQFTGLRNEALLDITEPLLRDEPNLKAFANNFDKTVRKNPTAMRELFGEEGVNELRRFRDIAAGVSKRPATKPQIELSRMGSVAALGHGIARAGMKVRLGQKIIEAIRGKSNKRETLGEILGYDPNAPLIPKTPIVIGGAIQAGQEDAENPPPR